MGCLPDMDVQMTKWIDLVKYNADFFEALIWMAVCMCIGALLMLLFYECRYRVGLAYQRNRESRGYK